MSMHIVDAADNRRLCPRSPLDLVCVTIVSIDLGVCVCRVGLTGKAEPLPVEIELANNK